MRKAITTITVSLFLLVALMTSGCEIRAYPVHGIYHSPNEVVTYKHGLIVEGFGEYCYEAGNDYCCVYYVDDYTYEWGNGECEITECYDYYTGHWYHEGEVCWYVE